MMIWRLLASVLAGVFAPVNGHRQAVSACPKSADIVAKVESCSGPNFW
jgi:hypothetical protein